MKLTSRDRKGIVGLYAPLIGRREAERLLPKETKREKVRDLSKLEGDTDNQSG